MITAEEMLAIMDGIIRGLLLIALIKYLTQDN